MTDPQQTRMAHLHADLMQGLQMLQSRQFQQALQVGQNLCGVADNYADAHHLVALAHINLGHNAEAEQAFRRAAALAPDNAHIHSNLGKLLKSSGRLKEAEQSFHRAVSADPAMMPAWFNLGLVLRFLGKPAQALTCFDKAEALGLKGPQLLDARSAAQIDLGEIAHAFQDVCKLISLHPQYTAGHVTRANLLWQYGELLQAEADPLLSFRQAAEAQPDNGQLQLAFIGFLMDVQHVEEALQRIRQLRQREDAPVLMALEADALDRLGELQSAKALYEKCLQLFGQNDPAFLNSFSRHLLKAGEWQQAERMAEKVTQLNTLDQEGWANLGTAWRLLQDEREFWLMDYERLITSIAVDPPAGYETMAAFLEQLIPALDRRHKSSREPAQQSLRGGSQTEGQLFGRDDPIIDKAETALLAAVNRHIASLPIDDSHPFLSRNTGRVKMRGSWSVKLRSSGNHVNHIHSHGWMSSAFYVSLPESVKHSTTLTDQAGWISFGQPPADLKLNLPARKSIQPKEGYLALFPSYMWHGTVPFEDTEPRLTIAFDMIPAAKP